MLQKTKRGRGDIMSGGGRMTRCERGGSITFEDVFSFRCVHG